MRRNRVEIFSITNLIGSHLEEFTNLNDTEKQEFLKGLERIILQNILSRSFRFGSDPPGYNVIEMLYLENNTLSLNSFYHTIRRVWSCVMLSVMYIQDFFSGEYNPEDYDDSTPSYHI